MKKLVVPKFETEAEEARWWDDHMDIVEENLLEAMESGTAKRGGPRRVLEERKNRAELLNVPLSPADLSTLRDLAARHGADERSFAGALLHEAIARQKGR